MPIVQCCFLLGRKYKCIPAEVCKYKCITKQMFFQLENVDNFCALIHNRKMKDFPCCHP